ncbi:hypothetical protein SAMN04489806_1054 [Paramicrobacterium humi]|uniref:Uncharacterized protein n=1 Tax=Paramicrobacterium humi TaxID=640635 RepID=A0A1H4K7M8_9MICO|nr:hypothetical protein [Microbacterium humi]SEB54544.1 hypothetical protein SAMN04489806_1054 [Microbacterium humi]
MSDTSVEIEAAAESAVMIDLVTGEIIDQQKMAKQLLAGAKAEGISLVGPDRLLDGLTKTILETALESEAHFCYANSVVA